MIRMHKFLMQIFGEGGSCGKLKVLAEGAGEGVGGPEGRPAPGPGFSSSGPERVRAIPKPFIFSLHERFRRHIEGVGRYQKITK